MLPNNIHARPVEQNEVRVIRRGAVRDEAILVTKGDNPTMLTVLPSTISVVPLLILGLDQCSTGAAAVAFAQFFCSALILANFDKIHRLIRDMKLALQRASKGNFLKAQLFSNHLWSINYKPHGSGLFGDQKEMLLDVFFACCNRFDPLFDQKYGHLIAKDFNMPFVSDTHKQAVWDEIPIRLRSFKEAMELPKMSRWLSWNSSAETQIPEFHACKMIFEWHIGDTARDPDLAAVQFDDLKKASTAKSSRAELQILHSASGGINFCYRLMSTMMLVMVKIIYVVEMAEWDFK